MPNYRYSITPEKRFAQSFNPIVRDLRDGMESVKEGQTQKYPWVVLPRFQHEALEDDICRGKSLNGVKYVNDTPGVDETSEEAYARTTGNKHKIQGVLDTLLDSCQLDMLNQEGKSKREVFNSFYTQSGFQWVAFASAGGLSGLWAPRVGGDYESNIVVGDNKVSILAEFNNLGFLSSSSETTENFCDCPLLLFESKSRTALYA